MDNLFLLAEEPNHPMAIAGCYRFTEPPQSAEVVDLFRRLTDAFPRFRQRVRTHDTGRDRHLHARLVCTRAG